MSWKMTAHHSDYRMDACFGIRDAFLVFNIGSNTLYFFKVAFSTFWFKFGATLRRQAERSDIEARHKAPNLT